MKIYVAGPYTPDTDDIHDAARIAHQNTLRAIRAGLRIIERGHLPFIPHLTHFMHLETENGLPKQFYYDYDMEWLSHCDALLLLPGSRVNGIWKSNGASREYYWAQQNGLRIYYDLLEIPTVIKT